MITLDTALVALLITLSVVYLVRLMLKNLRGSKGKGCHHCS